ncbi:MAG: UDP-N-acetylmuramoyl-tripeptide--D-alanyl-D-alanine ligase [Quisquiliibacterium sp.]
MFSLRNAFDSLSAGRLVGEGSERVASVCTDTRDLSPQCLFVALRGERFDAHDFLLQAQHSGAAAVLCERWPDALRLPGLLVADSRVALGEIARGWRQRFKLPLIAVAGSNGKTTVKEMIASILAVAFGEHGRLATEGNRNNEIGVPQTVFRLGEQHHAAVLELGMNHPGEIAWLAQVARPTIALVNNAQREHQEFLKSVKATAQENGAVISALSNDGVAVFPGGDPHAPIWRALAADRRRVEFGFDAALPVHAPAQSDPAGFELTVGGQSRSVSLSIDGLHNVHNALAAAACCHAAGVAIDTIASGLQAFRPVRGRMARRRCVGGAALIDDSYNANPDSVRAAIEVLAGWQGPRVLVLGDMGEVGEQGPQYHQEVGQYAAQRGVEHLLTLGSATQASVQAFGERGQHFGDDLEGLLERLRELATADACVLVKGSLFMRMGRVVEAIALDGRPGQGEH